MPQTNYKTSNIYVPLLHFKEKSSSLIRQLSQSSSNALQTLGYSYVLLQTLLSSNIPLFNAI